MAAGCVRWDRAIPGHYCDKLAQRNGLTLSRLAALNPVLGEDGVDCLKSFWLDYYYCVAVST
ncbi:hypothetical protein F4810DRAFT_665441 [Camillea tinctor]|nr:hypothetical protein F4810DRAFT_665441 [Camillea tinctor]